MPTGHYKEAQCNQRANILHLELNLHTSRAYPALSEMLSVAFFATKGPLALTFAGQETFLVPSGVLTFSLIEREITPFP